MSRHRTDLREVETSPDGRYVRFDEKLGNGAFKEVYLSYDTETGKEVAWNTVEMRRLPSNERRRIRSETEILAELCVHEDTPVLVLGTVDDQGVEHLTAAPTLLPAKAIEAHHLLAGPQGEAVHVASAPLHSGDARAQALYTVTQENGMTYRVTGQHELYVEWRGHVEFRMLKAPSGAHNYMRLYGLDPASKLVRPLLPAVKVLASSIAGEEEESVEDHEGLIPTPVQDRLFLTSDQAKEYLVAQMCANRVPVVQFGERIKIQAATLAQFKPADLRNVWGLRGRAMDDEPGCLPDGWKVDGRAYHSGALAVADVLAACKSLSGASVEKELLVNDVGVAQMPVCHSHTGGLVYAPGVDGRFGWRSPQSTDSIAIVLFLDNPSNPDDMTTMADGKTLAKPFQRLTRVMNTLPLDCRSRILVQHMVPVCSTKCTMQVSADCWRSVTSGNLALVQALRCTWVVAASKQVQAVFQRCDKICDSTLTDQHVAIQHRRYGGDTTDGGLDLDFNLIEIPHPSMPWHTRDIYAALATALCKLQAPAVEWDGRFPVDLATSCGSAFRHLRPITSVKCEGGPSRWVGISIREDHHLYQLGDTTLTGNSHPHIINFYHVWENKEKDQICFTTEIVTSGTLKQYTSRVKSIKLKVIKKWCRQILNALDYLHRHSPPIIHRDLKCDNIFINGGTGEIRLGDFGLSAHRTCTHVASVLGTPEFMAPELYEESYSESVDIYSFGMTVLEMTTKEYPYEECSNAAQIWKKVTAGLKPDVLNRIHDPQVRCFIELCITKDSNRLSAAELLAHPFLAFRKSDNFVRDNLVVSVEPRVSSRGNSKPNSGTQGGGGGGGGGGVKGEKKETIQQQQQAQQAAALAAAQAQANALFAAQQAALAAQLAYESGLSGHAHGGGIITSPSANANGNGVGAGGHSSTAKPPQPQRPQTSAVTTAGGPYHPPSDAYPGGGPPSTAPAATSTTPINNTGAPAPTGVSAILVEIESAHGATANIVLHIHLDGGRRKKQIKFALDFRHDTSMSLAGEMVSSLKLPDGERTTMMIASAMENRIDPVRKAYFAQMASESNSPLGAAQGGLETAGTEVSEASMMEHMQQQQQQQHQQLQAQQQALAAQQQAQQQQDRAFAHTSYTNPNASPSPAHAQAHTSSQSSNRSIYTAPGTSSAAVAANSIAGVSSVAAAGRTASTPVPTSTSPAASARPLNPNAAGPPPATSPAGTSRPLTGQPASATGLAKPPSGAQQHGPVTALPLHPQPQGQAGATSQTRLNTAPPGGATFAAASSPVSTGPRNLSKENLPVDGGASVPRAQTPMGTRPLFPNGAGSGRPVTAGPVASQTARGSNPANMAALAAAATAANAANPSGSLHHSNTMPAGMHKQQSQGDSAFPSMSELAAQMGQPSQPHGISSTSTQQPRPATAQPHRSSTLHAEHSPLPPVVPVSTTAGSPPPLLTLSSFNSSEDYEAYLASEFKSLSVGVLKERIRSAPGGGELVKACFEKPDLIQMLVRITVHDSSLHPAKPTAAASPSVNTTAPPRTAPAGARPHISFSSSASTPSHSQEPPDFLSPEPTLAQQGHHASHAPQSPPSGGSHAVPGPSLPSRQSSAVSAQPSPDPFLGLDALLSDPVPFSGTAHGAVGADHRFTQPAQQQLPVVPMRKISSLLDLDPAAPASAGSVHHAESARNAPQQSQPGGLHHVHHSIDGVYSPNAIGTAFSSSSNSPSSGGGSVHSRHESTDHERSPHTGQSHASSQQLAEDADSVVNSSAFDFQVSVSSPTADPDVGLDAGLDGLPGDGAGAAHQASLDEFLSPAAAVPHHRSSGGGSASAQSHLPHHGLNVNSSAVPHHAGSPTEPASAPSNMAPSSSFPYDLLSGSGTTAPAGAAPKPHHRPSASMDRSQRTRIGPSLGGVLEEFGSDDVAADTDSLQEFAPEGPHHQLDDDHASSNPPSTTSKPAARRHTEGPSGYSSRTLPAFASHATSPSAPMPNKAHTLGAPLGAGAASSVTSVDPDLFFVKPRTTDLLDPSNAHHLIPGNAALSSHHERLRAQQHSASTLPASLSLGELADMWGSSSSSGSSSQSQGGVTSLGTKGARSHTTGGGSVDTKSFDPFFLDTRPGSSASSLAHYSSEGPHAPPQTPTMAAGATKQQRTRSEADQAEAAIMQFQL